MARWPLNAAWRRGCRGAVDFQPFLHDRCWFAGEAGPCHGGRGVSQSPVAAGAGRDRGLWLVTVGMRTHTMSSGATFLAALAAEVPTSFWSMPALVACSGGADSVALLVGLARIALADSARRLVVVHAEHDLRAAAAADREFVESLAGRLGLRCISCRLDTRVESGPPRGEGVEARARRLRYEFFAAAARETGARHVAVAHTADDQAETILQRMLRGTGLVGLGGMRAARTLCDGVAVVRPLLRMPRADAREFLAAVAQDWREDESNASTAPARNFLRHEVLPRCVAGPFPGAVAALERLGRQSGLVAAALASAAEHLLEAHATRQADGSISVRASALTALDAHLVAEIFAALWRREGWPQRDMTAAHYARLAAVTVAIGRGDAQPGRGHDYPGGVRVMAGPGRTVLVRRG